MIRLFNRAQDKIMRMMIASSQVLQPYWWHEAWHCFAYRLPLHIRARIGCFDLFASTPNAHVS
jgi:hypothetical protein